MIILMNQACQCPHIYEVPSLGIWGGPGFLCDTHYAVGTTLLDFQGWVRGSLATWLCAGGVGHHGRMVAETAMPWGSPSQPPWRGYTVTQPASSTAPATEPRHQTRAKKRHRAGLPRSRQITAAQPCLGQHSRMGKRSKWRSRPRNSGMLLHRATGNKGVNFKATWPSPRGLSQLLGP